MIEKIKEDLLNSIGTKRYEHSLRVMDEANKLAEMYGVDQAKASIAGLLHDCGRLKEKSYLLKKAQDFGIILEDVYAKSDNLLHAYLGAEIAKQEYNIDDIDILNSIRYHTTGRENMSKLEKIIYMADYIEPGRDFDGIDKIRELCYKDLDKSLIRSIDNTIVYIIKRGLIIHEDTIKARNFLLFSLE
ncbi:metal dependent phosphohydrolase [Gottschalkia acidurici 9a]|uniref:bis(5'-nucleosyl)-tetraphosphatase (symmetrical) n=1 Tax=Gottschalkia acidurici (strain ATCC 7906 / DSM 604 / BCRC 14475 / CIP 104303 / KCTC 5404 / NCIMB 10678 / 9a) TaxID=1128398 RepID=K0B2Y3_GOTA9|nr:bis(5'-nucleosyl)-tetraphosphatase (symmetrical) YqeK [Gottschalkia acidurici]AFS78981.1 metal dependent phosphohydrolase [Gottschalkia acidurici 9a]